MKQTIYVRRPSGKDDWGNPVYGDVYEYSCRVEEDTEVVQNQYGEEAVSSAKIMLWKLADIGYDDTIEYTNELDVKIERKPIKIEILRWFDGKPRYTVVYV